MIIPEGYRLLNIGEYVPATALYYSDKDHWHRTPAAGQRHQESDGIVYVVPCDTTGTRIGSEAVSDYRDESEPLGEP